MQPLVTRILAQTRARLLGGDTHVADKVLSVFEPHTEAIRKGKIAKPTEFGKLVTIQESEHQIITRYEVHAVRPADMTLWTPALDRHMRSTSRSSAVRRISRRRTVVLPRARMKRRHSRVASAASSCRDPVEKRRPGARMSGSVGPVAASVGAWAAKVASVCSGDATVCDGVGIMERTAPPAGSGSA